MGTSNFKIVNERGTYKNVNIDQLKKIQIRNTEFPIRFLKSNPARDHQFGTRKPHFKNVVDYDSDNVWDTSNVEHNVGSPSEYTGDKWCNLSE